MPVDPTQPLVDAALTLLALWFVCTFAAAWIHGRGTRVAGTRVAGRTSHQVSHQVDAEHLADGQSTPGRQGDQVSRQVDAGYQWSPDVYDDWLS